MADGFADVRQTKEPENNDDYGRWDRNQKGEPAGLFRSEQIERADDQDRHGGEFFGMRHAEICKSGKRADGRRYQIVSDEKECADNGDDLAAVPHARIHAAAVRIKAADDHVIDADERGENAHGGDEPERCIAGNRECEADDVGFARAPVAVKNRGRARHIDIARAPNVSWYHFGWLRSLKSACESDEDIHVVGAARQPKRMNSHRPRSSECLDTSAHIQRY